MRYFLKNVPEGQTLAWLSNHDPEPSTVPVFCDNPDYGLVVAHLLGGTVLAEVITAADQFPEIFGAEGIPLGRLYFQIPRSALATECPLPKARRLLGCYDMILLFVLREPEIVHVDNAFLI